MAKVTTYSELLKQLEKARDRALKNVAENKKLVEVVQDRIQKDVYDSYDPIVYKPRTDELKDSVISEMVSDRNSPTIRISHDENKMNHTSIVHGSDVGHLLPLWINYGHVPNIFNNEHYPWQEPRPYMENSADILRNGKFKAEITKELKNVGIKTV